MIWLTCSQKAKQCRMLLGMCASLRSQGTDRQVQGSDTKFPRRYLCGKPGGRDWEGCLSRFYVFFLF